MDDPNIFWFFTSPSTLVNVDFDWRLLHLQQCHKCSAASLDSGSRRMICSSLISSGLECCISAWYPSLLEKSKKCLATLQRKMVRFVEDMGPREHVATDEINSPGWLPFPKRVKLFGKNALFPKLHCTGLCSFVRCPFSWPTSI